MLLRAASKGPAFKWIDAAGKRRDVVLCVCQHLFKKPDRSTEKISGFCICFFCLAAYSFDYLRSRGIYINFITNLRYDRRPNYFMCGPPPTAIYDFHWRQLSWVSVCVGRGDFTCRRRRPNEIAQFGGIKKAGNGIKQPLRCVISKCGAPKSISHTTLSCTLPGPTTEGPPQMSERARTLGKSICLSCCLTKQTQFSYYEILWCADGRAFGAEPKNLSISRL